MLLHPDSDGLAAGAIQAIVKPEGLERVGAPDERVVFDPRRHEVLVGEPATGAPALVVRPGYVLREPSQDSVLVKALVRPV